MPMFVQVNGGIVVNRSEFENGIPEGWPEAATWIASDVAQIGWKYENGTFIGPAPLMPPAEYSAGPTMFEILNKPATGG